MWTSVSPCLQGVLDEQSSPMCFELTDPVIHYRSTTG
jgi:hypothetical protein